MELLIKTLAGLEPALVRELQQLGAERITPLRRAVRCQADRRQLYRANLELRTALRVLVPIHKFRVRHENELYRQVQQVNWSEYMGLDDTLAVDAVTNSRHLKHSRFAALKTKDAIVDQFRQRTGRRPSVDTRSPSLRIHLHIGRDRGTLLLDSSGDSLHMRGYRLDTLEAPINEVLAAGMILLSQWQKDRPFIDPMCGSGTLLIEAAMYALQIPPQVHRRHFGFQNWSDYDPELWKSVQREAKEEILPAEEAPEILGFDRDRRAIQVSRKNIAAAGLEEYIVVRKSSFETLTLPYQKGLLMMNPPYDERLSEREIDAFYGQIGDRLKQSFAGYEAWIISANKEALKHIGLRPSRKMTLFNGPLECKFQRYELYEGSRKPK